MSGIIDLPPPGTNYIAIINPSIQSLMIGHTFLMLFIPLLAALFYYSTPCSRRQPIFILNVFALALAIATGIANSAVNIHSILSPRDMWPEQTQLLIALGLLLPFQAMLADAILLVRLITVHPPSRLGLLRFTLLTFLPMTLKGVRVANLIWYTNQLTVMSDGPNALQEFSATWLAGPYMKIEWIAQVVDNSYVSIAFLWTIRSFGTRAIPDDLMGTVSFSPFTERIRTLFNVALSNFIIPTVLSIVQLVLIFRLGNSNSALLNDIMYVNAMVSVFGLVFATVWAGKEHRREAKLARTPFLAEHGQRGAYGLEEWRVRANPTFVDVSNIECRRSDVTSSDASEQASVVA